MSVGSVQRTIAQVVLDNDLSFSDSQAIIDAAGNNFSTDEIMTVVTSLNDAFQNGNLQASDDTLKFLNNNLGTAYSLNQQFDTSKQTVQQRAPVLQNEETARLDPGHDTQSLGGTKLPAELKKALSKALKAGAEPYDVSQLAKPKKGNSTDDDAWVIEGKFTPYPQDIQANGTMAFSNTEITPAKLQHDMETVDTFKVYTGSKTEKNTDPRTGEVIETSRAQYREVTQKGTGNIASHYDHDSHTELNARGPQGQRWANNFALLSDGTLHALPAMRRTEMQPGLILTNPSLARGQRMLFNGHIQVKAGVITYVGMSGRLSKLAAKGDHKFVDPLPLLKAQGFKMAPGLQVSFEGDYKGKRPEIQPDGTIGN